MTQAKHLDLEALEAGLEWICRSPAKQGVVELIVRRPSRDAREVIQEGVLNVAEGLAGDDWFHRRRVAKTEAEPDTRTQLTIMNSRVADLVACKRERWALAGDQLFVDLDLSKKNLPVGSRLAIGAAQVEITDVNHDGCGKFSARYGAAALKFVNAPEGRKLRLRGVYCRVVEPGDIRVGEWVRKL